MKETACVQASLGSACSAGWLAGVFTLNGGVPSLEGAPRPWSDSLEETCVAWKAKSWRVLLLKNIEKLRGSDLGHGEAPAIPLKLLESCSLVQPKTGKAEIRKLPHHLHLVMPGSHWLPLPN